MNFSAVYIESNRYNTILSNFMNVTRSKKSNYKFDILKKNNEYFLAHQVNLPKDYKIISKDLSIRVILNYNELYIFYSTANRKKISQKFDLI
jgi:hypothetical protein